MRPEDIRDLAQRRHAAIKTNDVAGDGTTTATVLARAILTEGLRKLAVEHAVRWVPACTDVVLKEDTLRFNVSNSAAPRYQTIRQALVQSGLSAAGDPNKGRRGRETG